ncbi:hypothetical protein D3C87_1477740 [compost metagenome]
MAAIAGPGKAGRAMFKRTLSTSKARRHRTVTEPSSERQAGSLEGAGRPMPQRVGGLCAQGFGLFRTVSSLRCRRSHQNRSGWSRAPRFRVRAGPLGDKDEDFEPRGPCCPFADAFHVGGLCCDRSDLVARNGWRTGHQARGNRRRLQRQPVRLCRHPGLQG